MQDEEMKKNKAMSARDKKAPIGKDIDLSSYDPGDAAQDEGLDMESADKKTVETLKRAGMSERHDDRSGSLMMKDNKVSGACSYDDDVEIISIRDALKKYGWLESMSWKLVSPDADKYTSESYLGNADGYFIRVPKGKKVKRPIQTCLMISKKRIAQKVHNIVIIEEGAEANIITGCTTLEGVGSAVHLGISEMYVMKDAKLTFTMIHNWAKDVQVRPRTAIKVEEGGMFVSNYVCLGPAGSIQTYPTARLAGKGASARFSTIAVAHEGSELDLGSKVYLEAPGTRAEIISRNITAGGDMIARGEMVGSGEGSKGHLECKALSVTKKGSQKAIPVLEARTDNTELTHEAAVGKIDKEQVEYLMARGLDEEEAIGIIVRGFLNVDIDGLPENLSKEINETVSRIGKKAM